MSQLGWVSWARCYYDIFVATDAFVVAGLILSQNFDSEELVMHLRSCYFVGV